MSLAIETIEIGGIEDGRFVLGNHQRAAVLDIGTDWDRIRIGCRLAMDDTGAAIAGGPKLYIGLLSNPVVSDGQLTNGPLNGAATSHWLGVLTTGSGTWTRETGSDIIRYFTGSAPAYAKKVGDTITSFGGNAAIRLSAEPDVRRVAMLVDITKGSPAFTVQYARPSQASEEDTTLAVLRSAMEVSSLAAATTILNEGGFTYAAAASSTVAVDEGTDGPLNALCIAWDRTASLMRFSEVLFTTFPA